MGGLIGTWSGAKVISGITAKLSGLAVLAYGELGDRSQYPVRHSAARRARNSRTQPTLSRAHNMNRRAIVATTAHNPKLDQHPASNTEKNPDEWTTGNEPMTGAQTSYLKTLSEEAKDPGSFDDKLTKAEASKRIDALKQSVGH